MSSEDQELMARISQLAGRINRHKNQQAGLVSRTSSASQTSRHPRVDGFSGIGYTNGWRRGGSHPYRGAYGARPVHRNRTLILNGNSPHSTPGDPDSGATSDASNSSWVTKNGRNLQLINSSVYENDHQTRAKAMEQTRRYQQGLNDEHERTKLINHLNRVAPSGAMGPPGHQARRSSRYEVTIEGIRFAVTKNGSKLVKISGVSRSGPITTAQAHTIIDPNNSTATTPKTAVVGGVKFHRTKNGNLYRHGIVKAHRYASLSRFARPLTPTSRRQYGAVKVNEPCKNFSLTGNSLVHANRGPRPSRHDWDSVSSRIPTDMLVLGSCLKGPQCRFVHDPDKVAICKEFLLQGECFEGDSCDLSHDPSPERTPACMHFARDSCTKSDCRYAHVKVSPGAPVCRSFGIYGYCEKGANCTDRHAFECPDFSNTGVCKNKGCKLPHRERASSLRKAKEPSMDEEMEDVDSDHGAFNSDDVDSDEVDEFMGPDETDDTDYAGRDYIEV